MKVAIYQEGYWHCGPDVRKVFSTLELAKKHVPEGYTFMGSFTQEYAENKQDERWITLNEYQVIEEGKET